VTCNCDEFAERQGVPFFFSEPDHYIDA